MSDWGSALVFGLALLTFTLGMSSIIMSFITPKQADTLKRQVEYGFFGVSGIVLSLIFLYAMG